MTAHRHSMSNLPRLLLHSSGQIEISVGNERWQLSSDGQYMGEPAGDTPTEGWTELFVAELPEPDGTVDCIDSKGDDARTPMWRTSWGESVTAWIEGVETPCWELIEKMDDIRSDALKMLAAVAACERFQAEAKVAR